MDSSLYASVRKILWKVNVIRVSRLLDKKESKMYEKHFLRGWKESTILGPSLWLLVGGKNTKLYQGLSWLYFTRRGCHHRCCWIRILVSTRIRWRWLQVLRRRSFCWLRWRGQFGDWYPLRWGDRFDMMIFSRLFRSRVRVMEFIRGQTAFKSVTGDRR